MGKYLIYHMKKTVIRFIVMALFLLVIVNSTIVNSYWSSYLDTDRYNVSLSIFSVFAVLAPAVVTALEFSPFMSRRNLDTWFSFPISRTDLFMVHFGNGAIQLVVSMLLGASLASFRIGRYPVLDVSKAITYFACAIGVMLLIYMFFTFFFVSANNVFDGCVFMFGAYIVPACVFNIFQNFYFAVNTYRGQFSSYDDLPFDGGGIFSIVSQLGSRYERLIEPVYENTQTYISPSGAVREVRIPTVNIPQAAVWAVICIAALAGAVYVFTRKKTEAVSGVSESWFGYRLMIPLCTASSLQSTALITGAAMKDSGIMGMGLSLVGLIPTFIGVFVAYVIFRRGVKFKISDLISIGAVLVFYVVCLLSFKLLYA